MNMHYPSGDAMVELIPESAKLNINTATADDLMRVVTVVSGDSQRAAANRGRDSRLARRLGVPPIFDQYYFTIAPTFRARHASFEEIEELLLVRGMTPELFYGNYIPDSERAGCTPPAGCAIACRCGAAPGRSTSTPPVPR